MLRQTRQPMSVFLIPVNQSKQLWHHSTPEYIWHHLPKITNLSNRLYQPWPPQNKNSTWPYLYEIPAHFIHEIKTIAYDVIGVNVFLPTLMRIFPKKGVNFIPPILLPSRVFGNYQRRRLCSTDCCFLWYVRSKRWNSVVILPTFGRQIWSKVRGL